MKRKIDPFEYAGEICKALPAGILLTTKRGEEVNTMTIGWGHIGIEWKVPIFVAYVRESRYTKQFHADILVLDSPQDKRSHSSGGLFHYQRTGFFVAVNPITNEVGWNRIGFPG